MFYSFLFLTTTTESKSTGILADKLVFLYYKYQHGQLFPIQWKADTHSEKYDPHIALKALGTEV